MELQPSYRILRVIGNAKWYEYGNYWSKIINIGRFFNQNSDIKTHYILESDSTVVARLFLRSYENPHFPKRHVFHSMKLRDLCNTQHILTVKK